jgi:hypothetical protein
MERLMSCKMFCDTCAYFSVTPPARAINNSRAQFYGQCRRGPPTVVVLANNGVPYAATEWPIVAKEDFCGEFKAAAKTAV